MRSYNKQGMKIKKTLRDKASRGRFWIGYKLNTLNYCIMQLFSSLIPFARQSSVACSFELLEIVAFSSVPEIGSKVFGSYFVHSQE